jgi:hypothetical protein
MVDGEFIPSFIEVKEIYGLGEYYTRKYAKVFVV